MEELPAREVAARIGVSTDTLRRWVREGLIPLREGCWTEGAAAQAQAVARLRERGYGLGEIRRAASDGRLAFAYIEALMPEASGTESIDDVSRTTGLDVEQILEIMSAAGFPRRLEGFSDDDVEFLNMASQVLGAGLPVRALLQVLGVYGTMLSKVADVELRMLSMFVHEPMIKKGVPGLEMAENLQDVARHAFPYTGPMMRYVHERFVAHFLSQDVIVRSEMEMDDDTTRLDRVMVMVAFADLAGYTRFTEERGESEAVELVERFVSSVRDTLPEDARIVKSIGDEVMLVSTDPVSLTDWAVGFQELNPVRPRPRIGLHYGIVIYREADYFGSNVNLAARVTTRAMAGEILATSAVVGAVEGSNPHIAFNAIGDVRLKGFEEPISLFQVRPSTG